MWLNVKNLENECYPYGGTIQKRDPQDYILLMVEKSSALISHHPAMDHALGIWWCHAVQCLIILTGGAFVVYQVTREQRQVDHHETIEARLLCSRRMS